MTAEEIEMVVAAVLKKMEVVTEPHPDAPLPAQEAYSIKTCAHVSGLSSDHIRRAIIGGTLKASDVGTKDHPLYRVHRDNLRAWLSEREAGPKPPPRKSGPTISRHHRPKRASKMSV